MVVAFAAALCLEFRVQSPDGFAGAVCSYVEQKNHLRYLCTTILREQHC